MLALKSILRSATGAKAFTKLPTDLSIVRDEMTGRLITTPSNVVTKLEQMERVALSPDPILSPGTPFPWLSHVRPTSTSSVSMISGQIALAIMQETPRRNPEHKAAGPDGVPGLVLKHMPPTFHEALHLFFQALAITGTTPPS